jgi:hypothetical protein
MQSFCPAPFKKLPSAASTLRRPEKVLKPNRDATHSLKKLTLDLTHDPRLLKGAVSCEKNVFCVNKKFLIRSVDPATF